MRRLCLLLPLAAGCLDPEDDYLILDERFEAPVTDRWLVQGSVAQVQTLHPAEHGLQFTGWTTMSIPLSLSLYGELSDGNWLEYSSSCAGAPVLWAQRVADATYDVWVDLAFAEDGTPRAFRRVHANLPPLPVADDGSFTAVLGALHLESGPSGCVIDNLRVLQPAPDYGY